MRISFSLAALAATAVLAKTNVMVPLYVYPGNTTWTNPAWSAAISAIKSNPDLHFYVVINPNSGPKNTSDPSGFNGGYCNVYNDTNYIEHGCNRDWTTHLDSISSQENAQTIGYVYTNYGARDIDDVKADILEWSEWTREPTWTEGEEANIKMHGLWFDEMGTGSGNYSYYQELVTYANQSFTGSSTGSPSKKRGDYMVVLNAGPVDNATYEAQLFNLASAVVTKETCYTADPDASGVSWDCPAPYTPFDVTDLSAGNGLPHDSKFLPQTVVIVHQFVGPPNATVQMLQNQIDGVVDLGLHSTYFTSGSWHNTTIEPATIEQVGQILNVANGNGANGGYLVATMMRYSWIPWTVAGLLLLM